MQVMREGDGGMIAGIPSDDTACTGKGGTLELGNLGHGRIPKEVSDGLPDQGRAAELPCRGNFCSRHVWDIVIILEEGNLPYPRYSQCNMMFPWRALNSRHHATAMCKKGAERKTHWMAEAELQVSTERAFDTYGKEMETVSTSSTWRG